MKSTDKPFKFSRVLLVDDNDIDNFINERMITTSHFAPGVVVRNSAQNALDYLREIGEDAARLPEVIFLDLNMPVMDGLSFLKQLRSEFGPGDPPVVFTLGSSAVSAAGNFYVESAAAIAETLVRRVA